MHWQGRREQPLASGRAAALQSGGIAEHQPDFQDTFPRADIISTTLVSVVLPANRATAARPVTAS